MGFKFKGGALFDDAAGQDIVAPDGIALADLVGAAGASKTEIAALTRFRPRTPLRRRERPRRRPSTTCS